ncbi:MAG: 16S rRNA (guanine(527)-N(7))-methyltransferase RsmG [Aureispira sp.]|nr:16S rRNA (guanine(527)-N(7))-methyltransferase RsmG [Aureispira sp.]
MEALLKYFPDLSPLQLKQFDQLDALYKEWNAQINVISRKDIENLTTRHILYSLSIAKIIEFKAGSKVLDLGTGGGFPGIPLAILFPKTQFWLVDSIGKKIKVVEAVAEALGLKNVVAKNCRAESIKQRFDFVVTRAVAKLPQLLRWTRLLYSKKHQHIIPNGLLALKGTNNAAAETQQIGTDSYSEVHPVSEIFEGDYFETKCIVYVQSR